MNLLSQILIFLGSSIAGGITWDILKKSGSFIISQFNDKFTYFFEDENNAVLYLKELSTNEIDVNINPFEYATTLYNKFPLTKNENEFRDTLEEWFIHNAEAFEQLQNHNISIQINKLNTSSKSAVTIIGIQNNK